MSSLDLSTIGIILQLLTGVLYIVGQILGYNPFGTGGRGGSGMTPPVV